MFDRSYNGYEVLIKNFATCNRDGWVHKDMHQSMNVSD